MDYISPPKRKLHPRDRCNIISKIFFLYTIGVYKKGYSKDLEENNLYQVPSEFQAKKLGNKLEKKWEEEKKPGKEPSVTHLLLKCFGPTYFVLGFLQLIKDIAETVIPPYATGKLVSYFTPGQTELALKDAYFYAFVLIGFNFLERLWRSNFFLLLISLGIKMSSSFSSLLFRKILKLSPGPFGNISIGNIITLISKDVATFEIFLDYGNDLWVGPLKAIAVACVLYTRVGVAAFAGFCPFLIIIPLQVYIGSRITSLKLKMCKATDERLHVTQETLSAIRIIKMYTWDKFFNNKIFAARKEETYITYKIFFLRFIVRVLGHLNAHLAFYCLMMTYVWLGNNVSAEIVYFIKSSFDSVSYGMAFFLPLGIFQAAEVRSAVRRIGTILNAEELQIKKNLKNTDDAPSVTFNNLTLTLGGQKILKDINLEIKDKGLTVVTGPVGSGKSTLLKTIIQDYKPEQGHLEVQGNLSYASQEPWLFPSTIRQNILFGQEYDEKRYQEVLNVCALIYDLELLENGDKTIVEDRGGNLSKGQQARINLARAIYAERDIYALDDPLAALDIHVRLYIFEECIKKFLRKKLVILVTNDMSYLKEADMSVTMYNGCIQLVTKYTSSTKTNFLSTPHNLKKNEKKHEQDENVNEDINLIPKLASRQEVYRESKKSGVIDKMVYQKYIKHCGGYIILFMVFSVFIFCQFTMSYIDKLVSKWVDLEEKIFNTSSSNSWNITTNEANEEMFKERNTMLFLYNLLMIALIVTTVGRTMFLVFVTRRASIKLHKDMVRNIINASMQFFDTHFIGNILNRFSKDLLTIDEEIPIHLDYIFEVILGLSGAVILIASVDTMFIISTIIFFALLYFLKNCCVQSIRSLKRLEALTRSPVIGYMNATAEGLPTIRAQQNENILKDEFDHHLDLYNSTSFTLSSNLRALTLALDFLCIFYVGIIILKFLIDKKGANTAGDVGLTISQAFQLAGTLEWFFQEWIGIEKDMTSVERVLEYTDVKQESKQGLELEEWPKQGLIKYENVSLHYTHSEKPVLKNINFTLQPREKIAIIGRTGAGKSSIISTLFRLYDVEGKITIDNQDTKTLSLNFLRSQISIIPQEPVLFSGTIRDNIDPFKNHSDEEIWKTLETVHLAKSIVSLDSVIVGGGSSFSIGQKQLICIARAILQKNKIIVLDEATANMDAATDSLIHQTVEENFASYTVLMVTHKLNKILNYCDKVMVMHKGEIIEFDKPGNLLQNKNSALYKMVASTDLVLPQKFQ